MKLLPWVAALVIAALGAGAIWLVPRALPSTAPASPVPEPAAVNVPNDNAPAGQARGGLTAIEQISPIVDNDGALVEDLGLEMPGGVFMPVVPRGSRAPITKVFTIGTAARDQKQMRVHVLRGTSDRAGDNQSLGWFLIDDIPPGPATKTLITLVFTVADQAIVAAAVDPTSGRRLPFGPTEPPADR